MQKQLLTLICLAAFTTAQAQNSGIITYQEKVKLEIVIDDANAEMMKNIPKERTMEKVLYFTPDATLYKSEKEDDEPQEINMESNSEGGGGMMIKMKAPDDKVYCDLKNKMLTEQRDFMSRKFLIESPFDKTKWKLTGNQKMILTYPCQEAVLQDTTKKVIVWFSSAIPLSSGPNGYANLPGMILAADIDDGKRKITATNVELKEIDKTILLKPKEGKKTSKEEFSKIVKQKKKEMEEEKGGKGNIIIKIKN